MRGIWPTSALSLNGSSTMKFCFTMLLNEEENFSSCEARASPSNLMHLFGSKWEVEEYICRQVLLTEKTLDLQAPPIPLSPSLLFTSCSSSFQSHVSLSHKERTRKKERRKSSLMKCLVVYVPSHFVSLSWVNSWHVRKRLLRAVTTTSKMRHTLQEEYAILIKLVHLRIGSPPATKVGVALFSASSSHSRPLCHTVPRRLPFSQ